MDLQKRAIIGGISLDEANEMVKAYNADGQGITKSVWFSLEQLDQMVTLVKAEQTLGSAADGVRIYFGQYTQNTLGNAPKEYLGQNTVILVSTRAVARTPTPDNKDETYHQDYFEGLKFPAAEEAGDDNGKVSLKTTEPENRGELCQPKCQGVTLPLP